MLSRIARLLGYTATLVWLCRDPDWESLAAFLGSLILVVRYEIILPLNHKLILSGHDKNLIDDFRALFPVRSDEVEFLRTHDFGCAYKRSMRDPIYELADWTSSDYSFDDSELEQSRKELVCHIGKLAEAIPTRVYPVTENMYRVPPDSPTFSQDRDYLNRLRKSSYLALESFTRLIRTKNAEQDDAANPTPR